jgi:hypothetical protein
MATNRKEADARNLLEGLKQQLLQQAKEIDRDLEDLDRIAGKYGLVVVGAKAAEAMSSKRRHIPEKVAANGGALDGITQQSAIIRTVAEEHLRQTGARAMSSAIARVIAARGFEVPVKRVSSYLTRSDIFDNKPEYGGYGLAEWKGARAAPSRPASNAKLHE